MNEPKVIMRYGDSNTWGDLPTGGVGRFAREVRWPGALQNLLGDGYYVVEEGLCGFCGERSCGACEIVRETYLSDERQGELGCCKS